MNSTPDNPACPARVILDTLKARAGQFVSSAELRQAPAMTRAAVWKNIQTLRRLGYRLEACRRLGYRFLAAPDAPIPFEVLPLLATRRFGRRLIWKNKLPSTSHTLAELAETGEPEGAVVVADTQSAGRGRLSRPWFSPPRLNLHFSVLLRPRVPLEQSSSLPLLLALAIRRAARELATPVALAIKWPNDLWHEGRKVAGILCDMQAEPDRIRHVIAGIGLNVNPVAADFPPALRAGAGSLRLAAGRSFSRPAVLAAILNALEPLYDQWLEHGLAPFHDDIRAADLLCGRAVRLAQGNREADGRAEGITEQGALRLRTGADTVETIYSGDVHILHIGPKPVKGPACP